MTVQSEITFKGVEQTPEMGKFIARGLGKLTKISDRITNIRVVLEKAQGRHRTANPYQMQITIEIPDRVPFIIKRSSVVYKKIPETQEMPPPDSGEASETFRLEGRNSLRRRGTREESTLTLIEQTFDLALQKLKRTIEKQRGQIKNHHLAEDAIIEKVFRADGYGFIRTPEGENIYFNQNSVLHSHWKNLKVGTIVRYSVEVGDKGLQASTVEPVIIPGAAEAHNDLHELPAIAPGYQRKKKPPAVRRTTGKQISRPK